MAALSDHFKMAALWDTLYLLGDFTSRCEGVQLLRDSLLCVFNESLNSD